MVLPFCLQFGRFTNLDTHFQSKTAHGKHRYGVLFTDTDKEAQQGQGPAWYHTGNTESSYAVS